MMEKEIVKSLQKWLLLLTTFLFLILPYNFIEASQLGPVKVSGGQRDFIWPVPGYNNISSCFFDPDAITVTHERSKYHYALDIYTGSAVSVVASYDGTVVYADDTGSGFGKSIAIKHNYKLANGQTTILYTRYSHLSQILVKSGTDVKRGSTIGKTGGSGGNYAIHLDFQILQNSWGDYTVNSIDPYANQLLELPNGLYKGGTTGCCDNYISDVKNLYANNTGSSISISGANAPGTLNEGNVFSISGTVSSNQSLTKVTAGVYDLNDVQKTGKSASPYTTSYNIKGLDNEVYFNHLSAGVYRYKVIASTASKTETLVSKVFIILGNKQTIANGTYNFCSKGNTNLGLSISDNSHASGANVLLWENTASNNYMKWQVKYVSDGYYEIKNVATGLALDVKSAADANNANVHQYAANASIAQLWNFVPMGSYYCLVPKCARGRCLDVSEAKFNNGTNIQLWEANLNNAQLWKFSSTSKYTNKTVSIASAQITGLGNKVWTGKKLVPSLGVTVAGTKLVKGTHYTVSCTNNVNVGTAKITIKGKGKYTGSLTKSFKIIPRTTSVTVSKGKKRFIARWKLRIPQTSGYELQYSTNRSFKSFFKYITISNNLTLSKNVTNLKSKTTYYVRIRTYKLVGSKKYYSNWSKTVTVKPI